MAAESTSPRTRFERVVDNLRFRMFFTGFMCLLYLGVLVLSAMSFHIYPNEVDGALAYHVVLSIVTCAYSVFFLWRNLDGCTKQRVWQYLGLNMAVLVFWLAAFFALTVELAKTGNPNTNSSSSSGSGGTSSNSGSGQTSRRLRVRQSSSTDSGSNASSSNFQPAIGTVVLDLAIVFMYLVNIVYIYFRQQRLFPRYAELNDDDDAQAFNSEMTENNDSHDDEEAAHEQAQPQSQPQARPQGQSEYASYGAYDGQEDYRPGTNHTPPPRYGAEGGSPPLPYPQQQYGYQGQPAYGQSPQYPPAAAHEDTGYQGQTAYSRPHPPNSTTPYPRESMMGYGR